MWNHPCANNANWSGSLPDGGFSLSVEPYHEAHQVVKENDWASSRCASCDARTLDDSLWEIGILRCFSLHLALAQMSLSLLKDPPSLL